MGGVQRRRWSDALGPPRQSTREVLIRLTARQNVPLLFGLRGCRAQRASGRAPYGSCFDPSRSSSGEAPRNTSKKPFSDRRRPPATRRLLERGSSTFRPLKLRIAADRPQELSWNQAIADRLGLQRKQDCQGCAAVEAGYERKACRGAVSGVRFGHHSWRARGPKVLHTGEKGDAGRGEIAEHIGRNGRGIDRQERRLSEADEAKSGTKHLTSRPARRGWAAG